LISGYLPHAPPVVTNHALALAPLRSLGPIAFSGEASFDIYKIASKAVWLGIVEAPDKQIAIEKAAKEFKTDARRLFAEQRR
jgi:hypothetical protein